MEEIQQPGAISRELLLGIRPEIVKWFQYKAYGKSIIGEQDRPKECRSSTLVSYKKGLSHFMPRQMSPWDPVNQFGNPTRSEALNAVISKVKKFEVRKQGVETSARRPLEYKEYENILRLIKQKAMKSKKLEDQRKYFKTSALLSVQWHMISRIDDMCHLRYNDFSNHLDFPFTLRLQLRWSKNIIEERACPHQIILGAMDPLLCVLLNLAAFIELEGFGNFPEEGDEFIFGTKAERTIRMCLEEIITDPAFKDLVKGLLGTHSFRKGPATYASRCGVSRDIVNGRGRWRRNKKQVDVYIDIWLPYPDALIAGKLCGPAGPCRYALRKLPGQDNDITNNFLWTHVAPEAKSRLGEEIALVLALPLLWAAFEDEKLKLSPTATGEAPSQVPKTVALLHPALQDRIITSYQSVYGDLPGSISNPVMKIPIVPQGYGDQLYITELLAEDDGLAERGGGVRRPQEAGATDNDMPSLQQVGGNYMESMTAILGQQLSTQRRIEEVKSEILSELTRVSSNFSRQLRNIHSGIKRIAVQPVVRTWASSRCRRDRGGSSSSNTSGTVEINRIAAELYPRPQNLYDLWQEYEFGLSGKKAAKDFTRAERGKVKFAYCRRKVFWDVIVKLVNAGHTSDSAVDEVYNCYGRSLPVSTILRKMVHDRKTGGHPNLQI